MIFEDLLCILSHLLLLKTTCFREVLKILKIIKEEELFY